MLIIVIPYATLEACMAAFYGCAESELLQQGPFIWENDDGPCVWPIRRLIRVRKKWGTWGWCEQKKTIHVWISPEAEEHKIIELLAHELGHTEKPFHKTMQKEETKACRYAVIAQRAYKMMLDVQLRYEEDNEKI